MENQSSIDYRIESFLKESINILLYVVNDTEFAKTKNFLESKKKLINFNEQNLEFFVGKLGLYKFVLIRANNAGYSEPGSAFDTLSRALKVFTKIDYVVNVGVGASLSSKVNINDVVVASQLIDYESAKITYDDNHDEYIINRSLPLIQNHTLNTIKSAIADYTNSSTRIHIGKVITGEKLINNKEYKDYLRKKHPETLLLDMEGYSIASFARFNNLKDWIFIKGASDLANGSKKGSNNQEYTMSKVLNVLKILFNKANLFEKRKKRILISGSFVFDHEETSQCEEFSYKLSMALINNDFQIVNGYGMCVGNGVVAGAYNSNRYRPTVDGAGISNLIDIYPFPRLENKEITGFLEQIKEENRQNMIRGCSFAIFIYGLKSNNVLASGVANEFRRADQLGLFVIPVGSTGYKAKELWENISDSFSSYFPIKKPFKELFRRLNDKTLSIDESIDNVIDIIKAIDDLI